VTSDLATWGGTGRTVDLGGPVHYVEFGGTGPRVVLVHGLGGSHLNWCLLAPHLVEHATVTAVDLAGFGLTHPRGRSTRVQANADLLVRFLREVTGTPAVLVGNSMGGMVSILAAARHPDAVAGLALVDPSLPGAFGDPVDRVVMASFALYATPVLGARLLARRRATMTPRRLVDQVLDLCCVDPSSVPEDLRAASEALVVRRATVSGLDTAFLAAARSLLRVNARPAAYWATMASIAAPVLLIHGERDRLVPVRAARRAARRNPTWRLETLPDTGHVPQLEAPQRTAGLILDWLGQHPEAGQAAGRRADTG
jgi:pimeloyl-ACP methyl ester carboxylesterase